MLVPKAQLAEIYRQIKERAAGVEGCSVVLIVAPDADALAACKMLTSLMQLDYITYNIKPVASHTDIYARFATIRETMRETIRSVILLNCGGMIDLTDERCRVDVPNDEEADGSEHALELYVLDSNRPFSLENVREETHYVYVVDDALLPPVVQDLVELRDKLDEQEADEEESDEDAAPLDDAEAAESERAEQRRKLNDGRYATLSPNSRRGFRREVRQHLTAYQRGSWQSTSVAALCLELADQQRRMSNELLWLSAIGITDQFVHERVGQEHYALDVARHSELVLARNAADAAEALTTRHVDENGKAVEVPVASGGKRGVRLVCEQEYRFMLYRHWSLYDAMLHSAYVASRLTTWTERGENKLRGLFASMGIPLVQVQQKWCYMSDSVKRSLRPKLEEWASRVGLGEFSYESFVKVTAYRTQIAAADVVYAVAALLESGSARAPADTAQAGAGDDSGGGGSGARVADENSAAAGNAAGSGGGGNGSGDAPADGLPGAEQQPPQGKEAKWQLAFWRAYDALGAHSADEPELAAGLEMATRLQRAVVETAKLVIENKRVQPSGRFVKVSLGECPALHLFLESPMALSRLALFVADSLRDSGRRSKPVVISAPDALAKKHLIVAVTGSARFGDVRKNAFHSLFEKAAREMQAHFSQERFNTATVEVASSDVSVFFAHLATFAP